MSLKPIGIVALLLLLISIIYVWLNLDEYYLYELNSVLSIANFYTYSISLFIPIGAFLRLIWNPVASRAINPFTKKFIPTTVAVIVTVLGALVWYFVIMKYVQSFFVLLLTGYIQRSLSRVIEFGLGTLFFALLLIIVMVTLAFPIAIKRFPRLLRSVF